ncbi:hypothetical protein HD806DRAFT_510940 [Xylariaceae sp. AK1471]|nr:hypothetical protein HD806DRAFT_510940 [Xylariaceae sp. AK1471]
MPRSRPHQLSLLTKNQRTFLILFSLSILFSFPSKPTHANIRSLLLHSSSPQTFRRLPTTATANHLDQDAKLHHRRGVHMRPRAKDASSLHLLLQLQQPHHNRDLTHPEALPILRLLHRSRSLFHCRRRDPLQLHGRTSRARARSVQEC